MNDIHEYNKEARAFRAGWMAMFDLADGIMVPHGCQPTQEQFGRAWSRYCELRKAEHQASTDSAAVHSASNSQPRS